MKKHNRIIACIMAVCLMGSVSAVMESITPAVSLTASAESNENVYENLTYQFLEDGTIEITYCDESATEVVIPPEIDSVPVTSIGYNAFAGCKSLTSIEIPDSVTSIGYYAFYGCSNLTSVTIPDSVTSIGFSAFSNCSNLTSVTIPDSVTSIGNYAFSGTPWFEEKQKENPLVIVSNILIDGSTCSGDVIIPNNVTSIGDEAFSYCTSLTSVTIPDSVTSIGFSAFFNCSNLTSVTIPDSITSIGGSAFSGTALTSVTIPDSVTSIEDEAFSYCTSLTSVTIPESVTSIEGRVFSGTPWLEEKQKENPCVVVNNILIDGTACSGDVVIPDSVTSIAVFAFLSCQSLKSVTIPDSVTSIEEGAFKCCENLKSVTIPDSVTSIKPGTFSFCKSLKSVIIPESVTSIGAMAFSNCENLTEITILNPECEIEDDSGETIYNRLVNGNDGFTATWDYYFGGTIYGYENSTAQEYAEKYDRKFVSLGTAPEKNTPTGDMNGDGDFNISDIVTFQKYILGGSDTEVSDLKNADLNSDGLLDAFDLVMMRKKLIEK
ncbi:MAG: leucine-rich repeat protein [Ruminococcus sp.]|nr:leucine-rich repeat protein [Ruminococcus sp.]